MTKDDIIANLRAENRQLWETRLQQDVPVITTLYGYPLAGILDMIEDYETRMDKTPKAVVQHIVDRVCVEMQVTEAELRGRSRTKQIVSARQLAMRRLYDEGPEWSTPRVGRAFKRDHTTVLYALRKYPEGS
jgi:hypothetical protein